jgi:hypothetical protein
VLAGRYALDHEVGRGGTGPVWLGRDDVLGRRVALKRIGLLPGADRTDVARAEREARLSARLNHPHVVAIFDVVAEPGTEDWWLVMEYVEGRTLGQVVAERGPLPPDEAAPLLRQVAEALAAAHAVGITHRDVKPSNVLVDREGIAKLTDFGIARVANDVTLTQTGLMTGSPAYLAPEVASGGRGDEASDVWSLGATAFHVLAGRPPYATAEGNPLGVLYRIVHEEPPRLPGVGRLAALLEGTMAKDPARRWSMEQVREFLAGPSAAAITPTVPVSPESAADGPTRMLRPVAPTRRRPSPWVLAVAGALVSIVVVAVVAALSGGGSRTPEPGASASGGAAQAAAHPTAQGMEAFIRDYVTTVADDPGAAWQMLTPKFQRESGGLAHYRAFWDSATNGRVLDITADPATLTVSYQVRFDHFRNGPGPTVLDLAYQNGHYLIDGERTKGFVPAG